MKKLIFGMLVAVTAVGGSVATYASTLKNSSGKVIPQWYRYVEGEESEGSSYTATVGQPDGCDGGETLCAILAEPDPANPGHPIVTSQTDDAFKL